MIRKACVVEFQLLEFSAELWDTEVANRMYMLDSLLAQSNYFREMTRSELITLLGTNTYTESSNRYMIGGAKNPQSSGISIYFSFYEENGVEYCAGFRLFEGYEVCHEFETRAPFITSDSPKQSILNCFGNRIEKSPGQTEAQPYSLN